MLSSFARVLCLAPRAYYVSLQLFFIALLVKIAVWLCTPIPILMCPHLPLLQLPPGGPLWRDYLQFIMWCLARRRRRHVHKRFSRRGVSVGLSEGNQGCRAAVVCVLAPVDYPPITTSRRRWDLIRESSRYLDLCGSRRSENKSLHYIQPKTDVYGRISINIDKLVGYHGIDNRSRESLG